MSEAKLVPPAVVAVLGAGTMGGSIAQACAQAGYVVRLRDLTGELLDRAKGRIQKSLDRAVERAKISSGEAAAALGRITFTTDLASAVGGAALVIEAIFEDFEEKRKLLEAVGPLVGPTAIVATNTSSLSVTRLAASVPDPGRFAGLHFFYPAITNKLIEVIGGGPTTAATVARLEEFAWGLRKVPIRVGDHAGFAVNRFFVPYMNEAVRMAEEGVASLATIEKVGRELTGTENGPLEVMNLTGLPIALHAMESLEEAFGPAYAPAHLLEEMAGRRTTWAWREAVVEPEREAAVRERFEGVLFGIATELADEGVATPEAVETGALLGLKWRNPPFALLNRAGVPAALARVRAYAARWGEAFPVAPELIGRAERGETAWTIRYVRTERRGPVAWVLVDRPATMNSLHAELLRQLDAAFVDLAADADLRCVVLAGAGPNFCAGADIAEMAGKDPVGGRAFGFVGQAVCRRIEEFPHPVIGFVRGFALGGGLELALATDFIVATPDARLGLPEAKFGIHPGFGGLSRLTRLIGRSLTKLLLFSAETVRAEEAHRLGLVARLVPSDTGTADVQALAERIASLAPLALSWGKSVIDHGMDAPMVGALRLEGESAGHTFSTHDKAEGMQAFLERRTPRFEGR